MPFSASSGPDTGSTIQAPQNPRNDSSLKRVVFPPLIPLPSARDRANCRTGGQNSGPTLYLSFPLDPDHKLLTMVQYNVKRAIHANMAVLGITRLIPDRHCSVVRLPPLLIPLPASMPPSLRPTAIQLSVPHNPLITVAPFPALRNNLILQAEEYDMDELTADIFGGLFDGYSDTEIRGVMVWGEPWREDSWELTEGFIRKWGFLLRGCVELIESTNRWRDSRGEERLVVEV